MIPITITSTIAIRIIHTISVGMPALGPPVPSPDTGTAVAGGGGGGVDIGD